MPFAEINGTTMHYRIKGSGLPIIFVHPPLLEGNNFIYQLEQLSDSYQIITFDIRGHGQSRYSELPISFQLLAQDICQLLDFLKIKKACICGYSTGGSVALETILAYPDRFYGGILLSAMSEVSDPVLKSRFWASIYASALQAKRLLTAAITWGNADSLQTFKKLYSGAMRGDIRNHRQYYRCGMNYNCTQILKYIRVPMLLLYGEKDSGFHKYAKILKKHLPYSTLYFINNAKHQLPTKWAGPTNGLIRQWIEEQQFVKKLLPTNRNQDIPIFAFEPASVQEEQFRQE
ncbi:alpha/beta hydrolase [Paenibacillus filicis]|uniref:Alpha/beta hydrolase n=1 Tax=Paenibacillus gyeongsangnamensis TaxID=3388067 RepID=A0ABT4QLQ9_9BACL|nr:alpha/beta hydrolase [Paenibacillus filicis]MCZ8517747.1 alpha/beta hydrolase [Paenibacillus filicis]